MKLLISGAVLIVWIILGYTFFQNAYIALAIWIALYMAINIWANDVANSVGPAVGSWAIIIKQAILIAAVWNFSWAIIAGWDVVKTIKKWIIDISWVTTAYWTDWWEVFVIIMLAALLAWALWLTFATYIRAPVSTTHSIVWWVMGSWIAALGLWAVSWWTMWKIAATWIISPVLWWIVAATFLYWIKRTILFQDDKVESAKKWVPFYVAIMSWAFTTYLIIKWIKQVVKVEFLNAALIGMMIAAITFVIMRKALKKKKNLKNNKTSIASLFSIPLVFAVALLTFAHWANDVANAIGPIAAIYDTVINGNISSKVDLPVWILVLGWFGISFWLAIFGPRMIKLVWNEITELDRIRAFCIALAASITVIIASQLWLPVSSTHIAIGWIFGVWLLREWVYRAERVNGEKYVERWMIKKIVLAWLITVPASALLAWTLFMVIKDIML